MITSPIDPSNCLTSHLQGCRGKFRFINALIFHHFVKLFDSSDKDRVHTLPEPHVHDIKLDSLGTSVGFTFTIVLQNLVTTYHRKSGKSKYDRILPELDVVTMRI